MQQHLTIAIILQESKTITLSLQFTSLYSDSLSKFYTFLAGSTAFLMAPGGVQPKTKRVCI